MHSTASNYQDTWLVIPCFNEGKVIEDVIRNARKTFPNIVAVNDGSSDDSAARIHTAGAHLVNHPVNLGQGAAIQTGVEYARAQPGAKYFDLTLVAEIISCLFLVFLNWIIQEIHCVSLSDYSLFYNFHDLTQSIYPD